MSDRREVFFDTNILLYARLCQDEHKKSVARGLIRGCIQYDHCNITTQVVQEFCNNMMKKAGATETQVKEMLRGIKNNFNIVPVQMPIVERALDIKAHYGFSFWDSLVVAAALLLDCSVLYTEDLQANQVIEDTLSVVNPFVL